MNKDERQGTGYQHHEKPFTLKLQELQEKLEVTDIDFRVGRTMLKNNNAYGTLLAYKDSRVDMKRLDKVFGGEWKNTYKRDNNGVLQCEISIYNHDLGTWVSRVSNGTESQFESQKGEYSDAFKRAGFMWGIGRELYDMPDLFFQFHDEEFWVREWQDNGKTRQKVETNYKFTPNDWIWTVDWEHEGTHGERGLVHAKQRGSSSYRVKPVNIKLKHQI